MPTTGSITEIAAIAVVGDVEIVGRGGSGDAGDVVGVVGRQRHLDQLAHRSLDDVELLAAVARSRRRRASISVSPNSR